MFYGALLLTGANLALRLISTGFQVYLSGRMGAAGIGLLPRQAEAILDSGAVAEEGSVEDIFAHPATDAARRLVYPGGVSVKQYPAGTRAVRVAFNGGTAYEPLIATLAIDCGVKVNILGADTRNIDGKAFGTMLLGLPDDPNEAAKALSYIRSQHNVTAEEVEYHA